MCSGVDPIAWLASPVVEPPSEPPSLALVQSANTRQWVQEQSRSAPKLLLTTKALPPHPTWGDVLRHLRSNDRRGETDQQVKTGGWVVSDVLNARNAHSCYWLSEEVRTVPYVTLPAFRYVWLFRGGAVRWQAAVVP